MRYNIYNIRTGLISENVIEVHSNPECDLEISIFDMSLRSILGCFDISNLVLNTSNVKSSDLFLLYYYCSTPDNIMYIKRFLQHVSQATLDDFIVLHSIIMSYPDEFISKDYKFFEPKKQKSLTFEVINAV